MLNSVLVEFVGTTIFLFSIITTGNPIIFSITLAVMVYIGKYLVGHGVNYNPAITVMMVAAKKQPMNTLAPFIVAQIAGGLAAFQLHKLIK